MNLEPAPDPAAEGRVKQAVNDAAVVFASVPADDAEALIAGAVLSAHLLTATGMPLDEYAAMIAEAMSHLPTERTARA